MYSCVISWWGAMSRPKHVETNFKWNIYLIVATGWCSHLLFMKLSLSLWNGNQQNTLFRLMFQFISTCLLHVSNISYGMFSMRLYSINAWNTYHIRQHVQYSLPEDEHKVFEICRRQKLNWNIKTAFCWLTFASHVAPPPQDLNLIVNSVYM